MSLRKSLSVALIAGGLPLAAGAGLAQTSYPSAPLRVIQFEPVGDPSDAFAKFIVEDQKKG
jgi:hypothetical protein